MPRPPFRKPMLGKAAKGKLPKGSRFAVEQKFDGVRLVIDVAKNEHSPVPDILSRTRLGNYWELHENLLRELRTFPIGTYDGELVLSGGKSSDVCTDDNASKLCFVMFDVLELQGEEQMDQKWLARRELLEGAWLQAVQESKRASAPALSRVTLSAFIEVKTWEDVERLVDTIWEQGGEGVMIKDMDGKYECGKRRWLKLKELGSATLEILGFCPSEGEIMQLGDFGTVVLQDEEGVIVPVKVKDDDERKKLESQFVRPGATYYEWREERLLSGKKIRFFTNHPVVGKRRLCIEFQNRTTDGSYRHPRWNHLATDGHTCGGQ